MMKMIIENWEVLNKNLSTTSVPLRFKLKFL